MKSILLIVIAGIFGIGCFDSPKKPSATKNSQVKSAADGKADASNSEREVTENSGTKDSLESDGLSNDGKSKTQSKKDSEVSDGDANDNLPEPLPPEGPAAMDEAAFPLSPIPPTLGATSSTDPNGDSNAAANQAASTSSAGTSASTASTTAAATPAPTTPAVTPAPTTPAPVSTAPVKTIIGGCVVGESPTLKGQTIVQNGKAVGAHCVYMGNGGEDCNQTCRRLADTTCDLGGTQFLGSGGNYSYCSAVAQFMGINVTNPLYAGTFSDDDSGCTYGDWMATSQSIQLMVRPGIATTCEQKNSDQNRRRLCSCTKAP